MLAGSPNSLSIPNPSHPLAKGRLFWSLATPRTFGGGVVVNLMASAATNGRLVSGPKWITGPPRTGGCGSLSFDGTASYVSVNVPDGSGDLTVMAWAYPTTVTGVRNIGSAGTAAGYSWQLRQDSGTWNWYIKGLGDNNVSATVTNNKWQHIAGTLIGQTQSIYLNGSLVASGSIGAARHAAGPNAYLGADGNDFVSGGQFWQGYIDDFSVHNAALTAQEIMQAYRSSLLGYPGLLARSSIRWGGPVTAPAATWMFNPANTQTARMLRGGIL